MKKYCFNYMVIGTRTFLPLFICVESTNQFSAFFRAKAYLKELKNPEKIKIWFKNYPDQIDAKFSTTTVPKDWKK